MEVKSKDILSQAAELGMAGTEDWAGRKLSQSHLKLTEL